MLWVFLTSHSFNVGGKTFLRYSATLDSARFNEFAVDRMYIILRFKRGDFLVRFTTDVAPLTSLVGEGAKKSAYSVYVKHAYVQKGLLDGEMRALKVRFGVIPTFWPSVEEKIWGHRLVEKTTYDYFKLEATADMGASLLYTCKRFHWNLNLGVFNGNGFKDVERDRHKDVMLNLNVYPSGFFKAGNLLGFHILSHTTTQGLGFKERHIGGVSLNTSLLSLMFSSAFYTLEDGLEEYGASGFAVLHLLSGKLKIFGRYDMMHIKDGGEDPVRYAIGGLSLTLSENLMLALSYKSPSHRDKTVGLHVQAKF